MLPTPRAPRGNRSGALVNAPIEETRQREVLRPTMPDEATSAVTVHPGTLRVRNLGALPSAQPVPE